MTQFLKGLKEKAERATPGGLWSTGTVEHISFDEFDKNEPGVFYSRGPKLCVTKESFFGSEGDVYRKQVTRDREFIAAANPAAILKLIQALEILDGALDKIEETASYDILDAVIDDARAKVAKLLEET